MRRRKNGIWIVVATVVVGCGLLLLLALAVMRAGLHDLGEWMSWEGECLSKNSPRDIIEQMSNVNLPTGVMNLEVDSLATAARECDIFVKFNIAVTEWENFLALNQLDMLPDFMDIDQIRGQWRLSDIAWPENENAIYFTGIMTSIPSEYTWIAVDITRNNIYTVYAHTYLM